VWDGSDSSYAWPLWMLVMVLLGLAIVLMVANRPASHDG
jgi:hypothetical protein